MKLNFKIIFHFFGLLLLFNGGFGWDIFSSMQANISDFFTGRNNNSGGDHSVIDIYPQKDKFNTPYNMGSLPRK